MKKIKILVFALLMCAIATGCSDKASKLRTSFIDGCKGGANVPTSVCSCIYDHLEADYGKDRLVEMDEHPNPTANMRLAEKAMAFVPMCMKK
ncbi:hypothetical protein [Achromobacter aloeverae]